MSNIIDCGIFVCKCCQTKITNTSTKIIVISYTECDDEPVFNVTLNPNQTKIFTHNSNSFATAAKPSEYNIEYSICFPSLSQTPTISLTSSITPTPTTTTTSTPTSTSTPSQTLTNTPTNSITPTSKRPTNENPSQIFTYCHRLGEWCPPLGHTKRFVPKQRRPRRRAYLRCRAGASSGGAR